MRIRGKLSRGWRMAKMPKAQRQPGPVNIAFAKNPDVKVVMRYGDAM